MNKQRRISEKEFELINILATGMAANQRELAQNVGISLGMVNLLLKRLVTKGYLRVRQLNRRKVDHLLTAKGITEKARKSYFYTLKTLSSLTHIKVHIQTLVLELYDQGHHQFVLIGQNDLADLTEIAIRQMAKSGIQVERLPILDTRVSRGVVLWSDDQTPAPLHKDVKVIHLLEALAHQPPAQSHISRNRSAPRPIAMGSSLR